MAHVYRVSIVHRELELVRSAQIVQERAYVRGGDCILLCTNLIIRANLFFFLFFLQSILMLEKCFQIFDG